MKILLGLLLLCALQAPRTANAEEVTLLTVTTSWREYIEELRSKIHTVRSSSVYRSAGTDPPMTSTKVWHLLGRNKVVIYTNDQKNDKAIGANDDYSFYLLGKSDSKWYVDNLKFSDGNGAPLAYTVFVDDAVQFPFVYNYGYLNKTVDARHFQAIAIHPAPEEEGLEPWRIEYECDQRFYAYCKGEIIVDRGRRWLPLAVRGRAEEVKENVEPRHFRIEAVNSKFEMHAGLPIPTRWEQKQWFDEKLAHEFSSSFDLSSALDEPDEGVFRLPAFGLPEVLQPTPASRGWSGYWYTSVAAMVLIAFGAMLKWRSMRRLGVQT